VDKCVFSDYFPSIPSLLKDSKGRSPYWICSYRSADGRWLKKSTKQKDRRNALEVCLALERAENAAKQGTLTEQRAKELIGNVLERVTGEKLVNYTIKGWIDHWLELKAKVRAANTMARYRQVARDFIKSLGDRANIPLTHLSSKDVLRYRDGLLANRRLAQTANNAIKIVSAMLSTAVRQQHIVSNPALAIEHLKVRVAERGVFTLEQVRKLLVAARGDWRGAIMFAHHTGARLSDVAKMQWENIDLQQKLIRFTPIKTPDKKPLVIPLHRELERELLKRPGIGKAYLFPSLATVKGTGGRHGLSGQFRAIMERAGVTGVIRQRDDGARAVSSLSFHSLRHTFTSNLLNKGVPEETRMKLTGHSTRDAHAGYTHHEWALLRASIDVLPDVTEAQR
jgi:integrase